MQFQVASKVHILMDLSYIHQNALFLVSTLWKINATLEGH